MPKIRQTGMSSLFDGKLCNKCHKWYALTEFYDQCNSPDGLRYACKYCTMARRREKRKNWTQERREADRKQRYEWLRRTPERYRKYIDHFRQWSKRNPDKIAQYQKKFKEKQPDYYTKYYQRWRAKYPERNTQIRREWEKNNPDKVQAKADRRRARLVAAPGSYTPEDWREIMERYGNRCLCCGATGRLTADHVRPISKGGSNDPSNLQPLCRKCNSAKGAKHIDYRPSVLIPVAR